MWGIAVLVEHNTPNSNSKQYKYYSLSHKTVNTREKFWNVYCFVTNQMWDETAKDNCHSPLNFSLSQQENTQTLGVARFKPSARFIQVRTKRYMAYHRNVIYNLSNIQLQKLDRKLNKLKWGCGTTAGWKTSPYVHLPLGGKPRASCTP